MHVMCTASGGIFQAARINGIDCIFDPPRVFQIPEKEDIAPTEDVMAEGCVENKERDDTVTNNKKNAESSEASPSLALGYGGTEVGKIISGCPGEKARARTFLKLIDTYLAMHHGNGRVKAMKMLCTLKTPALQPVFIVPGAFADAMEKMGN